MRHRCDARASVGLAGWCLHTPSRPAESLVVVGAADGGADGSQVADAGSAVVDRGRLTDLFGDELDEGQRPTDDNAVIMVEYHHPSGTHLVDEQWSDEECERYVRGLGDEEFFF